MPGSSPGMTMVCGGWPLSLRHPHRAHHEGRDVIAHALLLGTAGLRRVALRPLGRGAVNDVAAFPLALVLRLVLVVPDIAAALIPLAGAVAVLRGRAPLGARLLMSWGMAFAVGRYTRPLGAVVAA